MIGFIGGVHRGWEKGQVRRTAVPSKPVMIAQKPAAHCAKDMVSKVRCTYSTPNAISRHPPLFRWCILGHDAVWYAVIGTDSIIADGSLSRERERSARWPSAKEPGYG